VKLSGLMMGINRAMLARAFRLIAAGAPAPIHGGIAVDLLKQGISAIRNATTDDAKGAAFTDGGASFPIGMDL
jgi:hypothetical protein